MSRIFDIIAKLERDERRFWKRMAKFDRDIASGKNRNFQLTREWTNFNMGDGPEQKSKRIVEIWNPDTQAWERPLPVSAREGN